MKAKHVISVVFYGSAEGTPNPDSDAKEAKVFPLVCLPSPIVFDHEYIIFDYRTNRY